MTGVDGLMAESNERWTAAIRRAQGIQDNGLGEVLKTYYTRYFPVGLLLPVAVGTVIGALIFPDAPEKGPTFLAFGIVLGAIGVLIGGLIYNAKKVAPAAQVGRIDVLVSLEPDERKRVRWEIAGKTPLDQEHLPVIRAATVQLRKNLATLLLIQPMTPPVFVPQALNFARRYGRRRRRVHDLSIKFSGNIAFEAPHNLAFALAFERSFGHVLLRSGIRAHAAQDDVVQGFIGVAVTAAA
jgi:hypothetical protein